MKKNTCSNCGNTVFREGFLSGEKGLLYLVSGRPGLKNQLFGKRKKLKAMVCTNCGNTMIFASKRK